MNEEESKEEAIFPVCVLEINRGDIESALYSFEEDVQEQLKKITWDAELLDKLIVRLREKIMLYYRDRYLLPSVIEEILRGEIEKMKSKRGFISGLNEYIMGNKKK